MLDLRATTAEAVIDRIVDQMAITDQVRADDRAHLLQLLLLRHRHVGEGGASPAHQPSYNSLYQYLNKPRPQTVSPHYGTSRITTTLRIDPRLSHATPPVVVVTEPKTNGHMPLRLRPSMSMDGGDMRPDRVDMSSFDQGEATEEQLLQRSVSGASAMKRVRSRVRTLKFGARRVDDQDRTGAVDPDLMKRLPPGLLSLSFLLLSDMFGWRQVFSMGSSSLAYLSHDSLCGRL